MGLLYLNVSRILFYNMICEFSVFSLLFGLLYFLLPTTCSSDKERLSLFFFFSNLYLFGLVVSDLKENPENGHVMNH